jgi:glycosyltransferase involved in cell wall biosynthesis
MKTERLDIRIALLTSHGPEDRRSWSGIVYYMATALKQCCGEVSYIGPLHPIFETLAGFALQRSSKFFLNKKFVYEESSLAAKAYARVAARKLAGQSFDVIVAPAGAAEVAFLKTDIPIVLVADATYALIIDYYPEFSNVLKSSVRQMHRIQHRALAKASQIVFCSSWAAESAVKDYDVDPRKVHVIPFGANLERPPDKETVLQRQKSQRCRLLFVGVHWQRKGGDIAFETLLALEKLGIEAELIVCGCIPPKSISHERMKVIPFLDKNDERQRKELDELYMNADFFLVPSRQEGYGIVFCEASAFGLPIVSTNTGGISEIVKDGENGFLLPPDARGAAYADVIADVYLDDERYIQLVAGARSAFDSRLNWDAWQVAFKEILVRLVDTRSSSS